MSLATTNAETPKCKALLVSELTADHIGHEVTFYYKGSNPHYTCRKGKLEAIGKGNATITVEVNDSDSRFKTFVAARIPHNGAIAVY